MIYLDRHNLYCNAFDCVEGSNFIIFKHNGQFFSVETMVWAGQENSVYIWDTYEEMVEGIAWHDWIKAGITDDKLKEDTKDK